MHDGNNKTDTSFLCYHFYTELELIFSHAHCLYDYPEKKSYKRSNFPFPWETESLKVSILGWMETDLLRFIL